MVINVPAFDWFQDKVRGGKVEIAQEAICKYLDARFGDSSKDLQKKHS